MKTIQIHVQSRTVASYLITFLLLLGLMESLLRVDRISSRLAVPSFGSEHHQFELQLSRLKAAYQKQGYIDCIFIGDSLAWLDMDPLKFSEGYQAKTGEDITCFNFGIAALPASGVSVLAEIFVKEYNPKLIVYGLHANSVVVARDHADTNIVLDTAWVKYKASEFNVIGWLYEYSHFVRNLGTLSRLMQFDREALKNGLGTEPYQLLGFDPKLGQRIDVSISPSRSNEADVNGFEKYYQYRIFPENLSGIKHIAGMADNDTKVVMVMMPVNKSFYAFFENGVQDYIQITEIIQNTLADTNSILLKTEGRILLPDSVWWDYSHLNLIGAREFSYWLGGEVENESSVP